MKGYFPKRYTLFTILCIILTITLTPLSTSSNTSFVTQIDYHEVLSTIIDQIDTHFENEPYSLTHNLKSIAHELHYNQYIKKATCIQQSITIEFTDGYQLVILEPKIQERKHMIVNDIDHLQSTIIDSTQTALLLHPFAQIYGTRQCRIISRLLKYKNIATTYIGDQDVNLQYIQQNLSADIIYLNTHAGFWDLNGSQRTESVIIATGEEWTNDTPSKYSFEYTNQFIVEGMVGKTGYIAFTPALIEYYYNNTAFNDSLIYMATCHALHDSSMASVFLDKDAAVYLSWTQDTVFWTNSLTSIWTFRLLSLGISIESICKIIGRGGFYNWLFDSKLSYLGDGNYTFN